jgi:putative addiction module antidote
MQNVKLIKIGNSVGVVLPKDVLKRLNVDVGHQLTLTDAPDGVRLSTHDPARAEELERARAIMAKRRHALRELAK